jgi:hypothetical protein
MKTIQSTIIGELKQDKEFEDCWESKPIEIPFFDKIPLKISFMEFYAEEEPEFVPEADQTLRNFLNKTNSDRFKASKAVYDNCMEFLNAVGYDEMDEPMWNIKDPNEIWKFVYPEEIYVARSHENDIDMCLILICECEWEQEHGLQLVYKEGTELTQVGPQDGW